MSNPQVVSREEWLKARKAHLKNEKALTRMRDLVSAERRALPWVKVDKEYVFDAPEGKRTLSELFGKNSQLIVHHFMWRHDLDMGCVSCSLEADHAEGALVHLENHDVSYVRVSRAPLAKLEAYKKRLGWKAKWVSSYANDFNFDYHVSFTKEDSPRARSTTTTAGRRVRRIARAQRLLQGQGRHRLPHLLELRPWQRRGDRRLHLSRHHAQGPQREGDHGVGEAQRRVRRTRRHQSLLPLVAAASTSNGRKHHGFEGSENRLSCA